MVRLRRSKRACWTLGVTCLATIAVPALAASAPSATAPKVTPVHGKPFRPALGDWEGNVGGFPASFQLQLIPTSTGPQYSLRTVVALIPVGCPRVSSDYSGSVIDSKRGAVLGAHGRFRLSKFGYAGSFTGARSATLSTRYGTPACGHLGWTLHPARRRPVKSGTWRILFADGASSRFSVIGSGRLASGIHLPPALTTCNGATGTIGLFISASGRAATSQPEVRASARFGYTKASGRLDASGRGCTSGPVSFTARRLSG
jgi:hypothetical protein